MAEPLRCNHLCATSAVQTQSSPPVLKPNTSSSGWFVFDVQAGLTLTSITALNIQYIFT